jgi:hypothetical protein
LPVLRLIVVFLLVLEDSQDQLCVLLDLPEATEHVFNIALGKRGSGSSPEHIRIVTPVGLARKMAEVA